MANVKYFALLAQDGYFFDNYTYGNLQLSEDSTNKHAIYIDTVTGHKIDIVGTGLSYIQTAIIAGTISTIKFTDGEDANYLVFNRAKADGAAWNDAFATDGVDGMLTYLLRGNDNVAGAGVSDNPDGGGGNDVVHGGRGNDYVYGGSGADKLFGDKGSDFIFGFDGKDRMTGGKGSDTFSFYGLTGQDVITDFDAKGGGTKQDYLTIYTDDTFTIRRSGHDMVVKFDDGDVLRLLDVSHKDFNRDDITFF